MDEIIGGAIGFLLTQTGRVVVYVCSFGRWRGEPILGDEGRIYSAAGSLWFTRDEQVVITHTGQTFIGLAFYLVVILGAIAYAMHV
jgi:hypothetical protein